MNPKKNPAHFMDILSAVDILWRYAMETLLVVSHHSIVELKCFLWSKHKQNVERTVDLSVIWDTATFMWRPLILLPAIHFRAWLPHITRDVLTYFHRAPWRYVYWGTVQQQGHRRSIILDCRRPENLGMGGQSSTEVPDVDMSGKVVIVTGASAGTGKLFVSL